GSRVIDLGRLHRGARAALPAAADLVLAPAAPGSRARVVLAVFREISADGQGAIRAEVLSAFAGHAALAVANALRYEEVEEALQRQLDLNLRRASSSPPCPTSCEPRSRACWPPSRRSVASAAAWTTPA